MSGSTAWQSGSPSKDLRQYYRKIARALSPAIFLELDKLAEIDGVAIGFKVSF